MSSFTVINGLPIPTLSDAPNIETSIHPMANAIDTRLVARFDTLATRNAAIPSPISGMVCWCADTKELYVYSTSQWVGIKPRTFWNASTQNFTTATFANVTGLEFTVEQDSVYKISGLLNYTSSTTSNDFKTTWSGPGSISGQWCNSGPPTTMGNGGYTTSIFIGNEGWTSTILMGTNSTDSLSSRIEGILVTGGLSGSMQLRAALNTATGTGTFGTHCFLQVLKVG